MMWQERKSVIKGNIGEGIVDDYLISKGIIPYAPKSEGAHPFDRLCATRDKRRIFIAETKSKASRNKYPDTGFPVRNYHDYMHVQETYGIDIWCFWVDEGHRMIYGNKLNQLIQPRILEWDQPIGVKTCLYSIMVRDDRSLSVEKRPELYDGKITFPAKCNYPWFWDKEDIRRGIVYFPLEAMIHIADIDEGQAESLMIHSDRNHDY